MDRFAFFQILLYIGTVWGHGRMVEPPQRSSMWRYGFKTPKNYNDNELNCGGFAKMMEDGGRCGPCGDPWVSPRNNEAGGKYATGTIARQYAAGQIINVTVELTSNHKGYFEFRLCPNDNPNKPVTQACLNRNVLNILGYGKRYIIDTKDYNMFMEFQLSLPPGMTCSQCVLQWKWRAAQNKGPDGKGGECFGCGPQEHFINCADVSIASGTRPLRLNRPGHTGVYISKTGPKTVVSHTPSVTTTAQTKPQPQVYDPSVMEPPSGVYSNFYPTPSSTANDEQFLTRSSTSNNDQFSTQSSTANNDNFPTPSATSYRTSETNKMSKQKRHRNDHINNAQMSQNSQISKRRQYLATRQRTQQPTQRRQKQVSRQIVAQRRQQSVSRQRVKSTTQQRQQPIQRKGVQQMSNQMSYESMIDSKNEITALILKYMASLPMDTAMETAIRECDGYARPVCKALPMWTNNRPFDEWCSVLCPTGVCPAAVCSCTCPQQNSRYQQNRVQYSNSQNNLYHHQTRIRCKAISVWGDPSMDQWCSSTCNANPDNCPTDHCWCDGL